jgi:hypothetical protein
MEFMNKEVQHMTRKEEQKINEFCSNGNLEQYRRILGDIFKEIENGNCRISARYDMDCSSYDNGLIRISLCRTYQSPIHIIWTIFHEFGHHMDGPMETKDRNDLDKRISREISAWKFARTEILKYPDLAKQITDFDNYQKKCLESYYGKRKRELINEESSNN